VTHYHKQYSHTHTHTYEHTFTHYSLAKKTDSELSNLLVTHRERPATQADITAQMVQPLYAQLSTLSSSSTTLTSTSSSSSPPLQPLVNASARCDFLLRNSERRLRAYTASLGKSPQNELQLAFHLLEKEIQIQYVVRLLL
jgi:hypothetical protein